MRRMWKVLALMLAMGCVLAAYYAYPYWTLAQLDRALAERDVVALDTLIDWPRVRDALKADVTALTSRLVAKEAAASKSGLEGLGVLLGSALSGSFADRMIDGMATPHGVVRLLNQNTTGNKRLRDLVVATAYVSPTSFHVHVRHMPEAPVIIAVLEFAGLKWQVTRLILPLEAIERESANMRGLLEGLTIDRPATR